MTKILVCVAWPYAAGPRHLGHAVSTFIPADVFARYHRMKGDEVLMVGGSDMHGTPVTVRADREGLPPSAIAERYHALHEKNIAQLGVQYDLYWNTADPHHKQWVQEIFLALKAKGHVYEASMTSPFCTTDQRFLPDRYVEGTCPHCGFPRARGDQCENCGRLLDPFELKDPKCQIHGTTPIPRETKHFFFRLSAFQKPLTKWASKDKEHWRHHVLTFMRSWLREGLQDRPITRRVAARSTRPVRPGPAPLLRARHDARDEGYGLRVGGFRPTEQQRAPRRVRQLRTPCPDVRGQDLQSRHTAGRLPRRSGQVDGPRNRAAMEEGRTEPRICSSERCDEGSHPARSSGKSILRSEGAVGPDQEGSCGVRDRAARRLAGLPLARPHHGAVPSLQLLAAVACPRLRLRRAHAEVGGRPRGSAGRPGTARGQAAVHENRARDGRESDGPLRRPRRANRRRPGTSERGQSVRPPDRSRRRPPADRRGNSEELHGRSAPWAENRGPRKPGTRKAARR